MDLELDKTQNAYLRMKAALLQHEVPAGTFLNIGSIALKMRVSPTPIREALIRLAGEDVVEFVSGQGYRAKSISIRDFKAHYEMAFVISKYSIEKNRLAFEHASVSNGRTFSPAPTGILENITEAGSAASYLDELYERIAVLSGNARMVRATRHFGEHTHFIRRFGLMTMPGYVDFLIEMMRLEKFLLADDRTCALDILAHQYCAKRKMLEKLLQQFEFKMETSRVRFEDLLG